MWKKAIIVPIHKKGDSRDCKNYRDISLLPMVGKVFMKIIQSRLSRYREQTSRKEQAGFRQNRGCCDHIFTLRQLLEERIHCGKRTVIVFVDFRSVFDRVHWPALWKALAAELIPQKIINLIKTSYNQSSSQVRVRNELSEQFSIQAGVCQGDAASPLLFNIVVDAIMRKVFEARHGVQYDVNNYLTDLMYADDSAILVEEDAKATGILQDLAHVAQSYALEINGNKTKVMTSDGSPATIHVSSTRVEQVREFKYLQSLPDLTANSLCSFA